jgi:hypothetical protein
MASILRKAAKYRRVGTEALTEGEAHLKDKYTPPAVILTPPAGNKKSH